jgi:hypothetical protein
MWTSENEGNDKLWVKYPWRSRRMKGEGYKKRNSKGKENVREKEKKENVKGKKMREKGL